MTSLVEFVQSTTVGPGGCTSRVAASSRPGGLHALEIQPDLEAPARPGTDGAELLRASQAHVGLLRRQLDIGTEASRELDDPVMERAQCRLRAGVHRVDQLVAATRDRATLRGQCHEVGVAVAEPVLGLQPRDDLAVPLRAAGLDQRHPLVDRPAGGLLDVACLALGCVVEGRHRWFPPALTVRQSGLGLVVVFRGFTPRFGTRRPTKSATRQRRRSSRRDAGCRRTPSNRLRRSASRRRSRIRSSATMSA